MARCKTCRCKLNKGNTGEWVNSWINPGHNCTSCSGGSTQSTKSSSSRSEKNKRTKAATERGVQNAHAAANRIRSSKILKKPSFFASAAEKKAYRDAQRLEIRRIRSKNSGSLDKIINETNYHYSDQKWYDDQQQSSATTWEANNRCSCGYNGSYCIKRHIDGDCTKDNYS